MKTDKHRLLHLFRESAARKYSCHADDFLRDGNVFVEGGKRYLEVVTFGGNAVLTGHPNIIGWCREAFGETPGIEIMDGDNLYRLEEELRRSGYRFHGECIRYLHTGSPELAAPQGYSYRLLEKDQLKDIWDFPGFDNALSHDDTDRIAFAAFDKGVPVAMAGADNRDDLIWQIGIDTLPAHRHRGLAAYLVQTLAREIESRGKAVCYTTWGANIASQLIAHKAGFVPCMTFYYTKK